MSMYGKMGGLLIAVAIAGGAASYIAKVGNSVVASANKLAAATSCYIVREYNDGIALFEEGSEQPVAEFTLPAESISVADERLLEEGIRLSGIDDVLRLLEDLDIEL